MQRSQTSGCCRRSFHNITSLWRKSLTNSAGRPACLFNPVCACDGRVDNQQAAEWLSTAGKKTHRSEVPYSSHRVATFPPSLPLWFGSEEPLGVRRQEYHSQRMAERPPPQPLSSHHLIHFSCASSPASRRLPPSTGHITACFIGFNKVRRGPLFTCQTPHENTQI